MSKRNAIAKIGKHVVTFAGDGSSQLLTVGDVAALLNVSKSRLNKWRLSGDGPPYIKIGWTVRYSAAAVANYIAKQTKQSTSAA
jgi:hypothetical protein